VVCTDLISHGRISVLICAVLLQAMKQEPPLDAKCRDKFLVQSVAVTADKEFTSISAIVRALDSTQTLARH
jgi:hypothetical protein